MEGLEVDRKADGGGGDEERDGDNPKRAEEIPGAEAHGLRRGVADAEDGGDDQSGEEVERALPGAGCPEDEQDEAVAEGELDERAPLAEGVWLGEREGTVAAACGSGPWKGCIRHRAMVVVFECLEQRPGRAMRCVAEGEAARRAEANLDAMQDESPRGARSGLQSHKANEHGGLMPVVDTKLAASDHEALRADLGLVDGLDLHAQYYVDRTGGDFFDAVRVGTRVVFLLSDIAGRRREAGPIAAHTQEVFRAKAVELFGAGDVNLNEGTELLVQAINQAITGPTKEVRFDPTMVGCYDVELGILAYVNAGGQTAAIRDSEGTRLLPDVAMPLGLFTHLIYDASMQAFEPGAMLVIVTKGVTQSMRGKVPFGAERVMEVLRSSKQESAAEVCREVLEAAHRFEQGGWNRIAFWRKRVPEDMTALAMVRSRSAG